MQQPFQQYLVAGDTWKWTIVLPDYAPAVYTLKYFFRGPSKLDAIATSNDNGSNYSVSVAAGDTANLSAGVYQWQMVVVDGTGNRTELDRGQVEVLPNIETAGEGSEQRSWVKQMLDAIKANLLGSATRPEQEYQINGRMLRLYPREQLLKLEGEFTWRYRRELIEARVLPPSSNQVHASFGDQSNPVLTRLWKNFPGAGA